MKKILLILAMFMAVCSYAQEPLWWGYFNENDTKASNFHGVGTGAKENFEAAIFIPANHPVAGGATIKSIKIWFEEGHASKITSLKVWISKKLAANTAGAVYKQTVNISTLKDGANEITLDTPYKVNNEPIYVGYSIGLGEAIYPVMNGGEYCENSFFIRSSVNVTDWMALDGFGKLALMVLLDNVVINENSAAPANFGTAYVVKGGVVQVPVTVTNVGSKPLKSISYTITTNGVATEEKTVQLDNIPFNESKQLNIEFNADEETKKYEKTFTITKVNGVDNASDKKNAIGNLITMLEKPVVRPVVEEFTGTWCGWCTVGYDGMEKAHETFGDKVVLIAVHYGDPMEISDYSSVASRADGYPSSIIDRGIAAYPSPSNLKYYINQQIQNKIALASLQVSATWANSLKRVIRVNTRTKFVYSDDNVNYGIAFALIEDGMSGKTSNWQQTNYISGVDDYKDEYPFWYDSPSKVSGIKFNHVAVAAWNIADGVKNSVNPVIQAGEEQEFSFDANISTNKVIQDKTKLKMVAMLIDRSTGLIVNAAEAAVVEQDPTGIESINNEQLINNNEQSDGAVYDLSGRKVNSQLKKGLYIQNGKKFIKK